MYKLFSKHLLVFLWSVVLVLAGTGIQAQAPVTFGPYTYTVGSSSYQVKGTFTTQSWGEVYMALSFINNGGSPLDLSTATEAWFNTSASPTVINFPDLGSLSYPASSDVTVLPRGSTNIVQTRIYFPTDSWASKRLNSGQKFTINYNIGSSVTSADFQAIVQGARFYTGTWPRPNLYVPLTINVTGTNSRPALINIRDNSTGVTSASNLVGTTQLNVFADDALSIWGNSFLNGNVYYQSPYTQVAPLNLTATANMGAVSIPYTATTLPSARLAVNVSGLPSGITTRILLTGTNYPFFSEATITNGMNYVDMVPYDTYKVSVIRYVNEATNTMALPTAASNYVFSAQSGALSVSFTASTIKPFGVDGWPKYLSMGTVTLADGGNDGNLSRAPLNAIFKYSGSGMGDTGYLLDASAPNFPTTLTVQQARRLEQRYATLYGDNAPRTVMPVMVHYTAQASGGGIGEADVYNDNNLKIHYRNLIRETKTLLSFRDAAHPYPGTFVLNPDLLGAQQQAYSPNGFNHNEIYNHPIHVNEELVRAFQEEGLPVTSLPTFSNNWPGYYQSINFIIKTIGEGAIKFGWQENVWATGTALWVFAGNDQSQEKAQSVTAFMRDTMGVFTGPWKPDFVVLDRYEADCFSPRGSNYAYNTRAWDRFVNYAAAIGRNLDLPVMLWQIPGGHLITNSEPVQHYSISNHSSASATYFLGDANVGIGTSNVRPDVLALPLLPIPAVYNTTATRIGDWLNQTPNYDYSKSQLQKLADNNIFSILWGGGETIGVAPIGTNGDDDGWLASKLRDYNNGQRVYQQLNTSCTDNPTVNLAVPQVTGSTVVLTANAGVSCGTITRVDFYNGSTLLGSRTSTPYSYTWTGVAAGTYNNLTARVTASNSNTAVSNTVSATVTGTSSTSNACAGVPAWNAATIYSVLGIRVVYNGRLFSSMFWTQGDVPQIPYQLGMPWKDLGVCPASGGRIGSNAAENVGPKVVVSPNPTEDDVRVTITGIDGNVTLQLTNPKGSVVQSKELSAENQSIVEDINLRSHPSGVYFITVSQDTWVKTIKFVKK